MTRNLYSSLSAAILLLSMLTACGGGGPQTAPTQVKVSVNPRTVSLAAGATQQFAATVTGTTPTAVIWSLSGCSGSDCGGIDGSGLYTAPTSIPSAATVSVIAKLQSDSSKTGSATVTPTANLLRPGDYAFVFSGWKGQGGGAFSRQFLVGHFPADATGNITSGVEDMNDAAGVSLSMPITGTYTVNANHRGTLSIANAQETESFSMTVDPTGTKGHLIRQYNTGSPVSGSGCFEPQDGSAYSSAALAGSYAMELTAKPDDTHSMAAVGRFTVDSNGDISDGEMDMLAPAGSYNQMALGGSVSAPASDSGRGTASLTLTPQPGALSGAMQLVYYVISANRVVMMQTDVRGSAAPLLSGEAQRQTGTLSLATFNAPTIFELSGMNTYYQTAYVGQITPDGSGSMTGVFDQNYESNALLNQAFSGTYTLDSEGRATLAMLSGTAIAYFYGSNQAYLMQQPVAGGDILYGNVKPQTAGLYGPASLGALRISEPEPVSPFAESDSGLITFDGVGSASYEQDYTFFYADGTFIEQSQTGSASYTLDSNGRGVITVGTYVLPFWLVSSDEVTVIDTATAGVDYLPVVQHYLK